MSVFGRVCPQEMWRDSECWPAGTQVRIGELLGSSPRPSMQSPAGQGASTVLLPKVWRKCCVSPGRRSVGLELLELIVTSPLPSCRLLGAGHRDPLSLFFLPSLQCSPAESGPAWVPLTINKNSAPHRIAGAMIDGSRTVSLGGDNHQGEASVSPWYRC